MTDWEKHHQITGQLEECLRLQHLVLTRLEKLERDALSIPEPDERILAQRDAALDALRAPGLRIAMGWLEDNAPTAVWEEAVVFMKMADAATELAEGNTKA